MARSKSRRRSGRKSSNLLKYIRQLERSRPRRRRRAYRRRSDFVNRTLI